jgi:hypothetical protein
LLSMLLRFLFYMDISSKSYQLGNERHIRAYYLLLKFHALKYKKDRYMSLDVQKDLYYSKHRQDSYIHS